MSTIYETIPVDADTQLVVYYDDDYQIEAEEREMSEEEVLAEQHLIDTEGVYGVAVQKRQEWRNTATGETRYDWEETESIWGCFLDFEYTAQDVAKEHGFIDG